jgi:hypothetical protein
MSKRMRATQRRPPGSPPAAVEIALLLKRDTGIVVEPKTIHDFIVGRFLTLSILAHEIWEPHKQPGHPL